MRTSDCYDEQASTPDWRAISVRERYPRVEKESKDAGHKDVPRSLSLTASLYSQLGCNIGDPLSLRLSDVT